MGSKIRHCFVIFKTFLQIFVFFYDFNLQSPAVFLKKPTPVTKRQNIK